MKQMKRIVVWATVQYVVHVNGATLHVTGPEERKVAFGNGVNEFATLSGGQGYINSTVTVNAPDFVTFTGTSVNEMVSLIQEQQATITSQQEKIVALKQFVGMMPPAMPPATPPRTVECSDFTGGCVTPSIGMHAFSDRSYALNGPFTFGNVALLDGSWLYSNHGNDASRESFSITTYTQLRAVVGCIYRSHLGVHANNVPIWGGAQTIGDVNYIGIIEFTNGWSHRLYAALLDPGLQTFRCSTLTGAGMVGPFFSTP